MSGAFDSSTSTPSLPPHPHGRAYSPEIAFESPPSFGLPLVYYQPYSEPCIVARQSPLVRSEPRQPRSSASSPFHPGYDPADVQHFRPSGAHANRSLSLSQLTFRFARIPPDLQLAFSLALPLAEWVASCIAIENDGALREAARPPTATEAVVDTLEEAAGAAPTEALPSSTAEAVVRGAEERRQLLASPILSIYTYKEGVAFENSVLNHMRLTIVLAMAISVWQERESLDCLFWTFLINFTGVS
jgi:hypothetical protein